jgi:adenosine deaminase
MVRPKDHTNKVLKEENVCEIVLSAKAACEAKYRVRSSLFLCCRVPEDDPIVFMETARRIQQFRDRGCVGFATFGDDIPQEHVRLFAQSFWFMKNHNIRVVLSAARKHPKSVISATIDGGASRISGGYSLHTHPHLVKFLADRQIPVDISVTSSLRSTSRQMTPFAGNPIRFLHDNDVRLCICSLGRQLELYPTLSEVLERVVSTTNVKLYELPEVLARSVRSSSLPNAERELMYRAFLKETQAVLEKAGFRHFWKKALLPECTIPFPHPHPLLEARLAGIEASASSLPDRTPSPRRPSTGPTPAGPTTVKTPAGGTFTVTGGSSSLHVTQS